MKRAASARGGRAVPTGLEKVGDCVASFCIALAAIALAGIVLINCANVIGRFCFRRPIAWAEEAMVFLLVLAVFAGGAAACWRGAHIRIDALPARLPPPALKGVERLAAIVAAAILLAVAGGGADVVALLYAFGQRSNALALPMWIPQSFVVVGLALGSGLILLRVVQSFERRAGDGERS
jgi:C4-dicarboxylate transporter DctQ subunit